MPVEFKDYYAVLGVARDASEADLKQAFRKLAREFHPDVAKDKVRAEGRFKEINEANEVLSDPEKRRKYDELGANWNHPERAAPSARGGYDGEPGAGPDLHFEGTGFSDFFEQFFGSRGRAAGGGFGRARGPGDGDDERARRGQDIEGDLLVTLGEVLHGALRTITLQRGDPRTGGARAQTLQVKIPPGVREGQLIRLAGQGQAGVGGGAAGHLYLRVRLAQHPAFRVRGADLYHDLDLAPWEAVLGCTVDLATLDGVAALRIPAGTAAERTFRLRGQGLPRGDGTRGDLFAVVVIQVPPAVTAEQRAHWEKLAAAATFHPEEPAMNPRALAVFQPSAGLRYGLDAAAQLAGVPRRTLLLYCRAGLVQPVLQPPYGMLTFTEEAIHAVRHLEQARARLAADLDGLRALLALRAEVEQLRAELRFWRSR